MLRGHRRYRRQGPSPLPPRTAIAPPPNHRWPPPRHRRVCATDWARLPSGRPISGSLRPG
eukprot:3717336-Alexandrium_andersonii.AAC.1